MTDSHREDLVLGWDVGGTRSAAVVATREGKILERDEWESAVRRGPEAMIADFQWNALEDLFDEFNLTDEPGPGERRGWFYTGGGLPLNDDGTLLTTGHMHSRRLAPATATVYKEKILDKWPAKDDLQDETDPGKYCYPTDDQRDPPHATKPLDFTKSGSLR